MTRYVVAAPYVTLKHKDRTGTDILTGFYAGAPVPEDVDPESLQRLLDKGMVIDAGDPVAGIVAVPAGTPLPGEPPNVAVPEVPVTSLDQRMENARQSLNPKGRRPGQDDQRSLAEKAAADKAAADKAAADKATPEPPATNAPKADWVDYAVAQGEDRAKAEGMSKEQLTGKYGKR